jgi:hypothetical protein
MTMKKIDIAAVEAARHGSRLDLDQWKLGGVKWRAATRFQGSTALRAGLFSIHVDFGALQQIIEPSDPVPPISIGFD